VNYDLRTPCADCPFLEKAAHGFTIHRLEQFASGEFPCHKTAKLDDDSEDSVGFTAVATSKHCAGALIYLEKRGRSHQMMRIAERFGVYDATALDMQAAVR
jgi:hypothetical protein